MGLNYLGGVEARCLASVIGRLAVVHLREVGVTTSQWAAIFTAISTLPPHHMEADFSNNNLSMVRPAILSAAVVRVERVTLMSTKLTRVQSSAIINASCTNFGEIKELNIMFNNLSAIDPDRLATAAEHLVKLNLGWTKLRPDHVWSMFERLDQGEGRMEELRLSGVGLQELEPGLFGRVVSRLVLADLNFTGLQGSQVAALILEMKEATSLRELIVSRNDLSHIDSHGLRDVVKNLDSINLFETNLSFRQASIILNHFSEVDQYEVN